MKREKIMAVFTILTAMLFPITVYAVGNITEDTATEIDSFSDSETDSEALSDESALGQSKNEMFSDQEDLNKFTDDSIDDGNPLIQSFPSDFYDFFIYPIIENKYILNGQEIELYPTYKDQEGAIQSLYCMIPDFLHEVENAKGLSPITVDNWRNYYNHALDYIYNVDNYIDETEFGPSTLLYFFDFFENYYQNENIVNLTANNLSRSAEDVYILLPYDRSTIDSESGQIEPQTRAINYNISKAIDYAKQYVIYSNPQYGYLGGNDCTNFVSQIYYAGGLSQDTEYNTGWWHRNEGTYNYYSRSWINADAFVKYYKPVLSPFSQDSFWVWSAGVRAGDVMAMDTNQDGDFNHCGFCTETSNRQVVFRDNPYITYKDFKVAQHSGNYHEWVSSTKCHWEAPANPSSYTIVSKVHISNDDIFTDGT